MDVKQFWQDVVKKMQEISPDHSDGVIYLVSRHNREKNTTAGMICTARVEHAAECLVNNTHDLATPEQIRAFKERQEGAKKQILNAEISKRQQFVMVVDRDDANSKGIPVLAGVETESPGKSKSGASK